MLKVMAMMFFVASLGLATSCSKDDEVDNSSVVGTWYCGDEDTDVTLVFNKDYTGSFVDWHYTGSGTYSMTDSKSGKINFKYDEYGDPFIGKFEVAGTTMKFTYEGHQGIDMVLRKQ